jgi:hypothetical protein
MKLKIKHNDDHHGQLQDLEANCNICPLKEMDLCPYLERLAKCHIFNALKGQKVFNDISKEKRRYKRTITSIPAFINKNGSGKEIAPIGSIMDISLGGLRVSIPRGMKYKVLTGLRKAEFEITFTLPGEKEPIRVNCKSRRVVDSEDNIHVGASIIDADFHSYKSLTDYLM